MYEEQFLKTKFSISALFKVHFTDINYIHPTTFPVEQHNTNFQRNPLSSFRDETYRWSLKGSDDGAL
jgi:hypothetical protein